MNSLLGFVTAGVPQNFVALLWAGSQAAHVKFAQCGTPKLLNCSCSLYSTHISYRCGRGPRVGHPCFAGLRYTK